MRVLVSGSTGLVGSALVPRLVQSGHRVVRLVRSEGFNQGPAVLWDPERGSIDASGLENLDAVVHLAGENIGSGRWTKSKKRRIADSRVHGTELLARSVASVANPPQFFVSASAIGYYGDRGDEVLHEESPPGTGFLAQVCRDWEGATAPAAEKGLRVVTLRTGVVLSREGGALKRMLPPFKLGIGGRLGSGRQWMSWIALEDLVAVIEHVLEHNTLRGPVNAVAPTPVTNAAFTRALGRVLRRPTFVPLPALVIRLLFGEMGDALLLASTRVEPRRLQASGFRFSRNEIDNALRSVLRPT